MSHNGGDSPWGTSPVSTADPTTLDPVPRDPDAATPARSWSRVALGWLILLAVAGLWAWELNRLQAATLISESGWTHEDYAAAVRNRLILTLLFCGFLTLLLPRVLLGIGFVLLFVFTQVAWFYHDYFGRAISWTTIRTLHSEGGDSVVIDKAFILPSVMLIGLGLLLVKLALVYASRRCPIRWRYRAIPGAVLLLAYFGTILGFNAYSNTPLAGMKQWMSFDRVGVAHGYLVSWAGEMIYVDNATLLQQALNQRDLTTDRITPLEGPLDLPGHLVILQVESLDWHILGLQHQGVEVTPFFNQLRNRSMLFQVRSFHINGSADADFVMLHGYPPSNEVINYKIAGYPTDGTLPGLARAAGRPMYFYHGVDARFFNRGPAYAPMDWEQVNFRGRLIDDHGLPTGKWDAVHDRDLLQLVADQVNQASERGTYMAITYTSHTPWVMLADDEPRPFDNPDDKIYLRYFNSIHYTDHATRRFIEQLPKGTTVLIYSDHESAAGYGERQLKSGDPEYIPIMVYRVGEDLSAQQKTRELPEAMNGTWTMVDVAQWVRSWLIEPEPTPDQTPPTGSPPSDVPQGEPGSNEARADSNR